ncbi:DUF6177 family protein [Streptomyces sp. NPDC052051]|uniref:DUF6177 family protein n=1 Tax=Streptomyces sp. NPDC052051 TaxID=3154649 RepID=UPI00342C890A
MTKDVIALTPAMPDPATLLAGLYAGGPDLTVNTLADGAVLQLCTPGGTPLLSVEAPNLVHHPSEARRLLGNEVQLPDGPFWWTEARATVAVPEAEQLAASFAARLTTVLGGTTWPPEATSTDVVPVQALAPPAVPIGRPPAVDIQTARASVIIQERPIIALTTWLSHALAEATAHDRALQLITPPTSRLTLPTRAALGTRPHRWIVRHFDGSYYDGLSGTQLHWSNGAFTPLLTDDGRPCIAEPFKPDGSRAGNGTEQQLLLSLRTIHPATEDLLLGGALEATWQQLTGTLPTGWSTAEPVNLPWSRRQMTDLARSRARKSAQTWLLTIGSPEQPALATTRVLHTPAGIEEHITLALGYGPDGTVPLAGLPELAELLATEHNLHTMLTTQRTARRDLTVFPGPELPPAPVSLTLGPEAVAELGISHARDALPGNAPTRLGPAARPALHYPLGDGTDAQAWTRLQALTAHFEERHGTPGLRTASPAPPAPTSRPASP